MKTTILRIKKCLRRIEAMALAAMIMASSLTYTVTSAENNTEQELVVKHEEESEQDNLSPDINNSTENTGSEEKGTNEISEPESGLEENPETKKESEENSEQESDKEEDPEEKDETEEDSEIEEETEEDDVLKEKEANAEEETELEDPHIEYSVQADVEGYKIKLEAYNGVFPEEEELTLSAVKIEDQEILAEIDSKLSDVCEGEFKQISFDIKVLNAEGEELQPDRSKYIDNEDIVPIQLSIEFANDEIEEEEELEVFHFADDLSSMECLVSTVEGDEVTVEPEHFSVFTLLKTTHGSYYYGLPEPTGYRTYIEWMPNSTAGLRRLQKIYVYAKEGEQISFGSSTFKNLPGNEVKKSLSDSFGYSVASTNPAASSIAVTLPYSNSKGVMQENNVTNYYHIYTGSTDPAAVCAQIESSTSYGDPNIYLFTKEEIADVKNDSSNIFAPGTIYNWQQEYLGAKNSANPGGYTPISFTAPVTGVYTFRFFGTQYTDVKVAPKAKKTADFPQASLNYVGAWDITVTENATATSSIKGRTFTDALFWTIGANISAEEHIMDEFVYALTKDGFEYKVDFNGMDPFGFVFFTNKRGLLVSSDDHEDGHYRSFARSVKSKRNQLDDLIEMGVHINSTPTTEKDESYFLIFEKADTALLEHYTVPEKLADSDSIGTSEDAYDNFTFTGLNSSTPGEGTEGYGGYFSFDYDVTRDAAEESGKILPSTYEIVMTFTGNELLENEYGYAHGTPNEVILSNTLVNGTNKIFWDGKDEYGNVVIGNDEGIEYDIVSFTVKSGEVHFPLLDVENNPYGIKVVMQNDISGIDKSKIYYNNSDSDVYGNGIGDGKEMLDGVHSDQGEKKGAMAFGGNAGGSGDYCVIDIWSDYKIPTVITKSSGFKFKLRGLQNNNAFFEAKTAWQYYYSTLEGKEHFDSTLPWTNLPHKAEVVLQYRIVDKNTVGIGGIDTTSDDWQVNDTGAGKDWQIYSGPVTVRLQTGESDTDINEKEINLSSSYTTSFGKESSVGDYKSVTIESYRFEDNVDPATKDTYKKQASEGLCTFKNLPLHPKKDGAYDLTQFYQYRVVDIGNDSLESYATDELFDKDAAVDIQEGSGHITKRIYLEETLDYRYVGAPLFNLEFDQLWNDSGMSDTWRDGHRPKAVRVAILYGVPTYEDMDKTPEYDKTIETGYYGEDVEVVWRRIQKLKYLTLYADGTFRIDNDGTSRHLTEVGALDSPYAAYFPVGKYMSNGDPYFYKIRPISYSMNGTDFTPIEYWDVAYETVPKLSLPEFYGIDTDAFYENKDRVVFYKEEEATKTGVNPELYPKAVMYVDIPETAEIELTKTDDANTPILGKTASYEITNEAGKNLMFTMNSEGKYTYQGVDGTAGLPDGVTKVVTTSTSDSIVHASGLPLHAYSVREVNAPEGYQISPSSIDVEIMDFLSDSTTVDGVKHYLCKKSQIDIKIQEQLPNINPDLSPDHNSSTDTDSDSTPRLSPKPKTSPKPAPIMDDTDDDTDASESGDVNGKRLPKTGGLVGSLVATIMGIIMIGFGIYLIKPSKKRRNNKD